MISVFFTGSIMITNTVVRLAPRFFTTRIETFNHLRNKYKSVEKRYGEEFDILTEQYYNTMDEDHDHSRDLTYDEEQYLREYVRIGKRMDEIVIHLMQIYDVIDSDDVEVTEECNHSIDTAVNGTYENDIATVMSAVLTDDTGDSIDLNEDVMNSLYPSTLMRPHASRELERPYNFPLFFD